MLEKYYKHELVEKQVYDGWEKDNDFKSFFIDITIIFLFEFTSKTNIFFFISLARNKSFI